MLCFIFLTFSFIQHIISTKTKLSIMQISQFKKINEKLLTLKVFVGACVVAVSLKKEHSVAIASAIAAKKSGLKPFNLKLTCFKP